MQAPAMDRGNFEKLTITDQLQVVDEAVGGEPAVLIGSSLGGYVGALYAARNAQVQRLVLLAPAFNFHDLWMSSMEPEKLRLWREKGALPVFHYGEGREVPIGYQLIDDAAKYEPWPNVRQPALLFHGTDDASVPVEYSSAFVRDHPNARLIRMTSGHELTDVLDQIWDGAKLFLLDGETQK